MDLHVKPPHGDEIYYQRKESGGGVLDVDCQANHRQPVENVVFQEARPGRYSVKIRASKYGSSESHLSG